jgi:Fe-S-cluster containining protein
VKRPSRSGSRTSAPPDAAIARRSLLRADGDLVDAVDAKLARAARKAPGQMACKAGCSECCIGPFPINRLDAWRLREGLADLRSLDPARADAIVERARKAVTLFRSGFPGDPETGRLGGDEGIEDQFLERHAGVPCPVLDPASQTCELYAHRPLSCRIYGPPARFGGGSLPPCRLCFTTAGPEIIEANRVDPDPDGLEQAILSRLKRDDGDEGETLIACALVAGPNPGGDSTRGAAGAPPSRSPRNVS